MYYGYNRYQAGLEENPNFPFTAQKIRTKVMNEQNKQQTRRKERLKAMML